MPPLPIAHKHEKKIFNDFYNNHPRPTDATRRELAKLFLQKANHTTIFPKLPSMIKSYESKWKKSCLIKLAANQMNEQCNALLVNLSTPIDIPVPNDIDNMTIVRGVRNDSVAALKSTFPPSCVNETDAAVNDAHFPPDHDQNSTMLHSTVAIELGTSRKHRMCANFPICIKMVKECGGWKSSHCMLLNTNQITLPDLQTLKKLKLEHKRNVDREKKREKRRPLNDDDQQQYYL